jgi:hypothetical protein
MEAKNMEPHAISTFLDNLTSDLGSRRAIEFSASRQAYPMEQACRIFKGKGYVQERY